MVALVNLPKALEVSKVSFTYQEGTRTLEDVDFWADSGEFIAMLASNGSGKTTLVKVLLGLLSPDKGREDKRGGHQGPFTQGPVQSGRPCHAESC